LALLLRPLGIFPAGMRRVGADKVARGYRREAFDDAFARYLPPQVIKCFTPNVSGPKPSISSDQETPGLITSKSEKDPVNIGRASLDHLKRGKGGVVDMIPSIRKQVARAQLHQVPRPASHSRHAQKGKVN
jgi:hypothetical protein